MRRLYNRRVLRFRDGWYSRQKYPFLQENYEENCQKYNRVLDQQMEHKVKCTNRPDKMSVEERKINKELLEKSKAYFRNKKLLNK